MSDTNKNTNSLQNNNNSNPASAPLCTGCFEFFGNPHKDNMCSKCYKYQIFFYSIIIYISSKHKKDHVKLNPSKNNTNLQTDSR